LASPPTSNACRDWSTLEVATLPALPPSRHAKLLDQVWTTILQKHYDPTLHCLDWPALRMQYGEIVASAKDDAAAHAAINQMLGELEQSHLGLIPPRGGEADADDAPQLQRGGVAIVPVLVGDDVLATATPWHGSKPAVPAGARITAIAGTPIAELVAKANARGDARRVERDFHLRRDVAARLTCEPGRTLSVTWTGPRSKASQTKALPCRAPNVRTASFGNLRDVPIEIDSRVVAGTKTGYVRFNVWLMDLLPDLERAIAELRTAGIDSLVIDLRGNPGGVGMMAVPLARQLLDRPTDLGVMRMRGAEQRFAVTPVADPFRGPVAILVDAGTASTSEIFAQALRDLKRATIVGTSESQGAALPSLIERLDGGALLQYVVADYTSPAGIAVEGKGVAPDTRVTITHDAIADGRDPVLDAALEAVKQPSSHE
jgi:carboxyl-terminal processing protease